MEETKIEKPKELSHIPSNSFTWNQIIYHIVNLSEDEKSHILERKPMFPYWDVTKFSLVNDKGEKVTQVYCDEKPSFFLVNLFGYYLRIQIFLSSNPKLGLQRNEIQYSHYLSYIREIRNTTQNRDLSDGGELVTERQNSLKLSSLTSKKPKRTFREYYQGVQK